MKRFNRVLRCCGGGLAISIILGIALFPSTLLSFPYSYIGIVLTLFFIGVVAFYNDTKGDFKMKKKNVNYRQIKDFNEVFKLISEGEVVYWTGPGQKDPNDGWLHKYTSVTLPDTAERHFLKSSWYSKKWDHYTADISLTELTCGKWFMEGENNG